MGLGSRGSDGWLHGVVGRLRRVAHRVRDTANAEGDRWILWIPVFLGVGVASYFGLPTEPPLWLGAAAAVVGAGLAVAARQRPAVLAFVLAPTVAAAGFTAAQWRTAAVAAPALSRAVGPATVTGRLIGIEVRPHGHRVTLDSLRISFIPPQRTPERVRIGLRGSQPDSCPGRLDPSQGASPAPARAGRAGRVRLPAPVVLPRDRGRRLRTGSRRGRRPIGGDGTRRPLPWPCEPPASHWEPPRSSPDRRGRDSPPSPLALRASVNGSRAKCSTLNPESAAPSPPPS